MMYCGVTLHTSCYEVAVLTENFAQFGTKYFGNIDDETLEQWIELFGLRENEQCLWFFDEKYFDEFGNATFFYFEDDCHQVYLVPHRKILNLMQFLYEFSERSELTFDLSSSYVSASMVRLLDIEEMRVFKSGQLQFIF